MIWTPPVTLFFYFAGSYLRFVLYCVLGLMAFVELLDVVALMNNAGETGKDISFFWILVVALYNLPRLLEQMLPFGVFAGSVICFYFWSRNQEFVTARGFGQNIWQALSPVFAVVFLIGMFQITVMSPLVSAMSSQYEAEMDQIFNNRASGNLSISANGVWLRDRSDDRMMIIHGRKLDPDDARIEEPVLYHVDDKGALRSRISGQEMQLVDNQWRITGAREIANNGTVTALGEIGLNSILDKRSLSLSIRPPHTINVYSMPGFISVLKDAGLATEPYRVYFHQLLSTPFKLLGLVMLAASISLVHFSRQQRFRLIVIALSASFGFYFLSDLIFVLGNSSRLPYYVAGWAPALLIMCIGAVLLARVEEH